MLNKDLKDVTDPALKEALKIILKQAKKKKKNGKKMKISAVNKVLAYTPSSEKEKEKQRKQLIKDLKDGKKGLYTSPGGTRYHV